MSDFFFARSQMAMSLAFHIIFAALGIGMPLLMAIAEGMYLRTRQPVYLDLSKRWARGTAVLFAVGAVSGTVLSFDTWLVVAKLYGKSWGDYRHALLLGRVRVFHRGYFYWRVSLWLEPPLALFALAFGSRRRRQWHLFGYFRGDGQCLDERARGLQDRGWQDYRY